MKQLNACHAAHFQIPHRAEIWKGANGLDLKTDVQIQLNRFTCAHTMERCAFPSFSTTFVNSENNNQTTCKKNNLCKWCAEVEICTNANSTCISCSSFRLKVSSLIIFLGNLKTNITSQKQICDIFSLCEWDGSTCLLAVSTKSKVCFSPELCNKIIPSFRVLLPQPLFPLCCPSPLLRSYRSFSQFSFQRGNTKWNLKQILQKGQNFQTFQLKKPAMKQQQNWLRIFQKLDLSRTWDFNAIWQSSTFQKHFKFLFSPFSPFSSSSLSSPSSFN